MATFSTPAIRLVDKPPFPNIFIFLHFDFRLSIGPRVTSSTSTSKLRSRGWKAWRFASLKWAPLESSSRRKIIDPKDTPSLQPIICQNPRWAEWCLLTAVCSKPGRVMITYFNEYLVLISDQLRRLLSCLVPIHLTYLFHCILFPTLCHLYLFPTILWRHKMLPVFWHLVNS